ncbi:MAG: hypothetical protein ACHQK9_16195 [Reyranellales bacterium]
MPDKAARRPMRNIRRTMLALPQAGNAPGGAPRQCVYRAVRRACYASFVASTKDRVLTSDINATANLFLPLSVLLAFYSGFRLPNLWSVNYYIPSVFEGFYRRSLVGTLLYPFGAARFNYYFIGAIQAAVLLALLYLLVRRALRDELAIKALVLMFFLGPTGGYLFHEIGYVDQLLYLVLLGTLALRNATLGFLAMTASLFVHEMAAFTTIPLYLAHLVVGERYRSAILHGVGLFAIFCLIYLFCQSAAPADVDGLLRNISQKANYAPREDYYEVFRQALTGPRQHNYFRPALYYELGTALLIAFLTAASFLRGRPSARDVAKALVVLGACVSPLALGFFGWDAARWLFLSICSSLVVLIVFGVAGSSRAVLLILFVLLVFATQGRLEYFDDYRPRRLQFSPDVTGFLKNDFPRMVRTIPDQ